MADTLEQVLMTTAQAATALGGMLPPPANVVAQIIGVALGAGVGFAKAGKDPLVEIKRILSSVPEVEKVHDEWESVIDEKFRRKSNPPPAPKDEPCTSTDIYDED